MTKPILRIASRGSPLALAQSRLVRSALAAAHGWNGDLEQMAGKIEEATHTKWNRDSAVSYILNHHTWDKRVEVYDALLKKHFA